MEPTALVRLLEEAMPGVRFESAASIDLQTTVYVEAEQVSAVMQALKNRPELAFNLLAELTAVDFWPREPRFEIVYVLVSLEHRARMRVKVRLRADAAHVPTVSGIWMSANWLEREVWDLFGVVFDGHPDPRRLLMPDDWDGYPLRKDYPMQLQMVPKTTEAMQVTQEEFRANLERDRLTRR